MRGSGDYISREAAIEAMYKDAEAHPEHTFWVTQNEALRNIPAADVRPKWISVEERLPEKGQYLVAYHPCYWDMVESDKTFVGLDSYRASKVTPIYKRWARTKYQRITHWMPLPEPPKEET